MFAQHDQNGVLQPIAFGSKALTASQQGSFSQPEVECYAIVCALLKEMALTRYTTIIVSTDCRSIQFMVYHSQAYSKFQRWLLFLSSCDIVIRFLPASHPAIRWVDCMGRLPRDVSKQVFDKKPRHNQVDNLTYIDMEGLPSMTLDQAQQLVTAIQKYMKSPDGQRFLEARKDSRPLDTRKDSRPLDARKDSQPLDGKPTQTPYIARSVGDSPPNARDAHPGTGANTPTPFPTPCLLYTSPSPRDLSTSRMPSSA